MSVRLPGLLDAQLNEIARLQPTAGSVTLKMIGSGEATLTLPEDSPAVHIHDWVRIYTQRGPAGVFRVSNVSRNYKKQIDVTLLHGIDILADSVWAAQTEFTGTKQEFLTALLNQQTHLVNGVKPWTLGTCQATGTWEKTINYDRLSNLLEEMVQEGGGYYFTYDQSVFPWVISFVAKPAGVDSEFRLTRNVRGATVTYNDADLCTRLHLSVSSKHDKTDATTQQTETVYGSAVRTYNNTAAQAIWGIVVKTADIDTHDDIEEQHFDSADAWAANFLAQRAEPSVQIEIDGDELAELTGDTWDELSLGKLCQAALPEYGQTFRERVVSVTYPAFLKEPTHVNVSLANTLPRFSESIAQAQDTAAAAAHAGRVSARSNEKQEKDLTTWSQVVRYQGEALEGTGVTTLYESGISMDAAGGVKIYSLQQGLQALYSGIEVNTEGITLQGQKITSIATQAGVVTEVFDPTKSYAVGDKVSYEGVGYVFIAAQNGTEQNPIQWTPANVSAIQPLQSQITQEGDKIALVVDSNDKIKAASIILAINQTKDAQSQSSAEITADLIKLNGTTTTLNDKLYISSNKLYISDANLIVHGTNYDIGLADGNLSTHNLNLQNGSLAFTTSSGGTTETSTITAAKASKLITDLQLTLSDNTYTLQKKTVDNQNSWTDVGTFSRATSLSGVWSGRYYTVTATPQGDTKIGIVYDGLVPTGSVTKSGKNVSKSFIVYSDDGEGDADQIIMTKSVTISASDVYNDGWGAAYGKVSWPTAQTSNAYMDVAAPPQTVDGAATSKRFYVRSTNNVAYISIDNGNDTWTNYAAVTHNKYIAGQQSVTPTSATISNSVLNSSTNRREATLTVTYKGPDTTASTAPLSNVDVTSIYNAGYADGSTKTTYPVNFTVTFSDGHTGTVSADCANIWNQGADAAQPTTTYVYVYSTSNTGRCAWYPSRSGGSRTHWIPHNAKVILLDSSIPSSGRGYVGYYDDSRNYVTGYITASLLHTTAKSGYSSPTYGWDDDSPGPGPDPSKVVDYYMIVDTIYHNAEDHNQRITISIAARGESYATFTSWSLAAATYQQRYNAAEKNTTNITGAYHDEEAYGYRLQHVVPYWIVYTDGTHDEYTAVYYSTPS